MKLQERGALERGKYSRPWAPYYVVIFSVGLNPGGKAMNTVSLPALMSLQLQTKKKSSDFTVELTTDLSEQRYLSKDSPKFTTWEKQISHFCYNYTNCLSGCERIFNPLLVEFGIPILVSWYTCPQCTNGYKNGVSQQFHSNKHMY